MFYGPDQAAIHDKRFGTLARYAAADVIGAAVRAGHRCGTVVDLGCGSGILARAVGDAGYDLIGVDISADMIALAETNAPRARLAVGSLHDFPIPSGCVAVATTGEALNYATDPAPGWPQWRRWLPGYSQPWHQARRGCSTYPDPGGRDRPGWPSSFSGIRIGAWG